MVKPILLLKRQTMRKPHQSIHRTLRVILLKVPKSPFDLLCHPNLFWFSKDIALFATLEVTLNGLSQFVLAWSPILWVTNFIAKRAKHREVTITRPCFRSSQPQKKTLSSDGSGTKKWDWGLGGSKLFRRTLFFRKPLRTWLLQVVLKNPFFYGNEYLRLQNSNAL